jgi:hypothetical protein
MILTRVKYPPGSIFIQSISTGTISVVEGSAALVILEVASFTRKHVEWQAAGIVFALTLDAFAPTCKYPNPRVILWIVWDADPATFMLDESS